MRRGQALAKLKADLTKYVFNALLNSQHWGLFLFPKVEHSKSWACYRPDHQRS